MEPRNYSDPLEQLISDTLQERMGPAPSPTLWKRVQAEIAPPPRRHPAWLAWLRMTVQTPIAQSAVMVAMLGFLLVQPAFYWMHQEAPAAPSTMHVSTRTRPLPEPDRPVVEQIAHIPTAMPRPANSVVIEAQ